MNFTFRGLMAPVFTPFKDNMTLNLDIISNYADFLKGLGIDGILVNGTTGEGPSLSKEERKNLAEKWKKAVTKTKQHLMVQVGGCPLPDVVELAEHAQRIGVDSILCLPELYYKPSTADDLIDYLKEVGKAAQNTPILYYHIPSFSCVNINMVDLMKQIPEKVPNFFGLKFTSTQLDEATLALHVNKGKYPIFLGADNVLAGALALGIDSAIGTTFNIFPNLSIYIMNAMEESQNDKAKEAQNNLNNSIEVIKKYGSWVSTMKHAMNKLTPIKVGKVRKPLKNLSEDDGKRMDNELDTLVSSGAIKNYDM